MAKKLTGYGWYEFERSYVTSISKDYLDGEGSWDVWAALRECLQNAADEAQLMAENNGGQLLDYVKVVRGNYIKITDRGRGVDFSKILLLGRSDKRGTHFRGEKGEGQLMSFLVFAKLGIKLQMYSQDWMCEARFDKFEGSDDEVLVLDLYRLSENSKGSPKTLEGLGLGTVWRMDRNADLEYYVTNIGDYFPELSRRAMRKQAGHDRRWRGRYDQRIKKERRVAKQIARQKGTSSTKVVSKPRKGKPARLYLKGIWVRDLVDDVSALFSYNLNDVDVNRDRNMVNQHQLYGAVADALSTDEVTFTMMKEYWQEVFVRDDLLEYREVPKVEDDTIKAKWLKAFRSVYGKKTCVATNQYATQDCLAEKWAVVAIRSSNAQAFAKLVGVKTDIQVAGFTGDVKLVKATDKELAVLDICRQVCEKLGIGWQPVEVVGKVLGEDQTLGFYKNDKVYILRRVFVRGGMEVLRVIVHELGHHATGKGDFQRDFTDWFLQGWLGSLSKSAGWYAEMGELLANLEVVQATIKSH